MGATEHQAEAVIKFNNYEPILSTLPVNDRCYKLQFKLLAQLLEMPVSLSINTIIQLIDIPIQI